MLAFLLLVAFVCLAPFPYGAVTPNATFILTVAAFAIGALAFAARPQRKTLEAAIVPVAALVLVAVVGLFQLMPLTVVSLRSIAPLSASVYANVNETRSLFGLGPATPKISIAPWETQLTIELTLAYAALFSASAILSSTRTRRLLLVTALLTSSVIHVFWTTVTTPAGSERAHGTFINPNHFAGYLEIALAFAFGFLWREILYNRQRAEGLRDLADRMEKRAIPIIGAVLLWSVIAAGIALSRSRGGAAAAVIAALLMVVIAQVHRRSRGVAVVVMMFALFAALVFVAFTIGEISLLRFLASDPRDLGSDQRVELWRAAIRAWHLSPTFGTGLGTFREAFRRVQPASIEGLVEQAHNDFLQMLVTGGWVGAALVSIAFASMLVILVRAWLRQQHREESAFALAGIGAMISLMLHGLVEFNMSIPAIPATLAVMVGLAWAAARYETKSAGLRVAE